MEKSHFSLTWDKFYSTMCAGFSLLQQNGELVDLTLAADGRFVKVHKIVLSVASPFIKDLIQSADCKHPVIFLNNVSYKTLCSILEYLYTGEVSVEEENLKPFLEAAKSLQIKGLDVTLSAAVESTSKDSVNKKLDPKTENVLKISTSQNEEIKEVKQPEYTTRRNTPRKRKCTSYPNFEVKKEFDGSTNEKDPLEGNATDFSELENSDIDEMIMDSGSQEDYVSSENNDLSRIDGEENISKSGKKQECKPTTEFQYTVSNQGSLQMILNRFMYNLCSRGVSAPKGPVKSWRCVQYRTKNCPALAVTDHNVVIKRSNLHNHPFHDQRILAKIQKKAVYSAIQAKEMLSKAAK